MINIIACTALLYLIQLLLPSLTKKVGEDVSERSNKSVHNLRESLPVFFALAILSIVLGVEENTALAMYWLISRVIFAVLYSTGIGRKPAAEDSTYEPQLIRSLIWEISVFLLITMAVNLI